MIFILFIAFILRLYGINWDQGGHLHPDERMLIMVADQIHFFDKLNPNFFNYGTLPIYILKGTAQLIDYFFLSHLANYDGLLYVGRYLSILADLITIFLIYKIARLLFSEQNKLRAKSRSLTNTIPLISAFFYAIAFFPIQNSHFFVVDVFLTTFTTILFYLLFYYLSNDRGQDNKKYKKWGVVALLGIIFAAMLATKFTSVIFLPIILIIIVIKTIKQYRNIAIVFINFLTFNFSLLIFNFLFMPYAFIENKRFINDVLAQIRMNSNPYVFPYTLQYVDTLPYLYYLKNIFLWGLGPIVSTLSLIGLISLSKFLIFNSRFLIKSKFSNLKNKNSFQISNFEFKILFIFFYLFYFFIIGRSAVKFMRYMLPIYPFLTIMAGYGLYKVQSAKCKLQITYLVITLSVVYTLIFVNIYVQPHTRIAATNWILKNIPKGSTLAVEHWDDRIPLYSGENYNFVEMNLYELPDDEKKWLILNQRLNQTDYIIIASNRLYVPLQRLSDCNKYKVCYPKTAEYYRKLFKEELGFKKAAEFAVYPTFKVGRLTFNIDDQGADESFTVYDHPKIIIFKKI